MGRLAPSADRDDAQRVGVVGGNGKTGRAVVAALAARGLPAKALGRADSDALSAALAGSRSLYLIAPNMHEDEPEFVRHVLRAARNAGIEHVVYHSVAAPYAPAMPHHLGKAIGEDLVRRGPLPWTILQPAPYMQNFLPSLTAPEPAVRVAYDIHKSVGLVHLGDVAEVAVEALLGAEHRGATYELGGPELLTVAEVASAAGRVLGRPVPVVGIEPAEWLATFGAGLDARVASWLLAMFAYFDSYGMPVGGATLAALLGRKPTGIEDALRQGGLGG